jgi:hypothetical protein
MSPFPRKLVPFTIFLVSAAAAAALTLFWDEGVPDLTTLLIFGALIGCSAHLPVRLRNGVYVSPALVVCMAAIVVFDARGSLLGATLVCGFAQFRLSDIRRKRWGWVPFNFALSALSFLAAAGVYQLIGVTTIRSTPITALAAVPCALAYTVAAWGLIVLSYLCEGTARPRDVVAELVPGLLEFLPFAVLGVLLGRLYVALGPGVLALIIVPILIAREIFRSYARVADARDEIVQMLIRALEAKDAYTAGHAERVAKFAGYIGEEMKFGPARRERLHFGALMHDIGKLVVPNRILNKPGRLTDEEFQQIKVHEKVAVQMLSHIDFLRPIAHSGSSEHMKLDVDQSDRPIEPYIIMVADAFDAMTSTRSYRKALPQSVAFDELRNKTGVQFHAQCVDALIRAIERRGEEYGSGFEPDVHFLDAPASGVGSAGLGDLLKS